MDEDATREEKVEVKKLIINSQWDEGAINAKLTPEWAEFIIKDIRPCVNEPNDKAWWTGDPSRSFTVKSAYDIVRKRKGQVD